MQKHSQCLGHHALHHTTGRGWGLSTAGKSSTMLQSTTVKLSMALDWAMLRQQWEGKGLHVLSFPLRLDCGSCRSSGNQWNESDPRAGWREEKEMPVAPLALAQGSRAALCGLAMALPHHPPAASSGCPNSTPAPQSTGSGLAMQPSHEVLCCPQRPLHPLPSLEGQVPRGRPCWQQSRAGLASSTETPSVPPALQQPWHPDVSPSTGWYLSPLHTPLPHTPPCSPLDSPQAQALPP